MLHIIFDTNMWIYLAEGEHPIVLERLIQKIENKEVALLLSEIQIEEWDRNKANILEKLKKSIRYQGLSAQNIANYLSSPEKEKFTEILSEYRQNEGGIIQSAEQRFALIEELMNNKSIQIPVTDEMKLEVVNWALNKQAPFHKDKNAIADSLILLSAIKFVEANGINNINYNAIEISDSLFVSNNSAEFSKDNKGGDKDIIHPQLEPLLNSVGMRYERNLGKVLKLAEQMIEEIDNYMDYVDHMIEANFEMEAEILRGK